MKIEIEFKFEAADPKDAMSGDNVDIQMISVNDRPLAWRAQVDVQLETALRAAIYRLQAILPNEPA